MPGLPSNTEDGGEPSASSGHHLWADACLAWDEIGPAGHMVAWWEGRRPKTEGQGLPGGSAASHMAMR